MIADFKNEEYLLNIVEGGELSSKESTLLDNIHRQINLVEGIDNTDYITNYLNDLLGDSEYEIETLESFMSDGGDLENCYTDITDGLLKLISQEIGICVDTFREILDFSDLYDIYCTFVLSIGSTINNSYIGRYGTKLNNIDDLYNYMLTDEFSPMDDLIQNAIVGDVGNVRLNNVYEMVVDYRFTFCRDTFMEYARICIEKLFS